jgi:hypothetical protein
VASTLTDSASVLLERASATSRGLKDLSRDQPLVLAGIGFAIGAAIGASLPRTETEDRLAGETSDSFKERVRDVTEEQLEKAKSIGERAYEEISTDVERQDVSSAPAVDDTHHTQSDRAA